jgi:hypothetical protein
MTSGALPLDWTRLGRRRRLNNSGDYLDDNGQCLDVHCTGCLPPESTSIEDGEDGRSFRPIYGTAMLCLPDADNDWFQGYFFLSSSSSPSEDNNKNNSVYKLLCIQQDDTDPCLHCDDYQLWTVTVYYPTTELQRPTKQTRTFRNVVSRGGDSIRWHHQRIRFTADAVTTGGKAHVLVETYFGGLLQHLRDIPAADEDDDVIGAADGSIESVATLMPNVAVVTGDMTIWLPTEGE